MRSRFSFAETLSVALVALAPVVMGITGCGGTDNASPPSSVEGTGNTGSGTGGAGGSGGAGGGAGGSGGAIGLGGAGGTSATTTASPTGTTGGTTATLQGVAVSALTGGSVRDESGKATLLIPPGALASDVRITVAALAPTADTASPIYDYGPDGLTFSKPATLSIAYANAVPEGKKAVLATLGSSGWTEVPGSTLAAGLVSGPVQHFSKFTVILVAGGDVVVSACASMVDAFTACGGDPKGNWSFEDFCFSDLALGTSAIAAACPGFSVDLSADMKADLSITDTEILVGASTQTVTSTQKVPLSCLPAGTDCSSMTSKDQTQSGAQTCSEKASVCECSATQLDTSDPDRSTYTSNGTAMTITDPDSGKVQTAEYCVKGNHLEVKVLPAADSKDPTLVYSLVRK